MKKKAKHRSSNVDAQLVELAGRNWLVSQLIQGGIEVAKPERDCGVDLIAYIEKPFKACRIQIKVSSKSGFVVHREKYKSMCLVYVWNIKDSSRTVAYAMQCTEARMIAKKMGWTKNACWTKENGYWRVPSVSIDGRLQELLKPFQMSPNKWKKVLFAIWKGE